MPHRARIAQYDTSEHDALLEAEIESTYQYEARYPASPEEVAEAQQEDQRLAAMQQGEQAETERDYHQDELSQAGQDQQASDDQSMVSEDQEQNDNVQGRENGARYNQPSSEELHQRLAASRAELAEDQQQSEAGNEQEQVDEQDDNLNR